MAINVLCLFCMVPLVGLQCVIVALPVHTHSLFARYVILTNSVQKLYLFSEREDNKTKTILLQIQNSRCVTLYIQDLTRVLVYY